MFSEKDKIIFEIGSQNIKMVETVFKKDKIELKNAVVIPFPAGQETGNTVLNDPELAAGLISEAIKKYGFKSKNAAVVLSMDGIIARDIVIQKTNERDLDERIMNDLHKYLPVDLASYSVDFKVLSKTPVEGGNDFKVYIVAVPQKIIDAHILIAEKTKLSLGIIDINGNAFSKLLKLELKALDQNVKSEDTFIGIDIGGVGTYVVFIQNGIFQFGRDINFGGRELVNIVSDYLSVDSAEAQDILFKQGLKYINYEHNKGKKEEETIAIGKDINKKLDNFIQEINKIISFYQTRYSFGTINSIFLSGGAANIQGLDEHLKKKANIDIKRLSSLKCVYYAPKKNFDKEIISLSNVLGASIRD